MMKSCTIDNPAETQLDLQCLPIAILQEDNYFATMPVTTVLPGHVESGEDEEELYTSFEEAISERVARVSRQLSQLPLAVAPRALPAINPRARVIESLSGLPRTPQRFWSEGQRAVVLVCLGLSLLLAGFDLMGLLVIVR
jgi:hypothetical protein